MLDGSGRHFAGLVLSMIGQAFMFIVELALLDRVTVNNTSFISKIKRNLPQVEV